MLRIADGFFASPVRSSEHASYRQEWPHAESVRFKSLENLRARPWLRDLETGGKLTLHGWWFDIATGDLGIADPESGNFNAF